MRNTLLALLLLFSFAPYSQAEYLDDDALLTRAAEQHEAARSLIDQNQQQRAVEILDSLRAQLEVRLLGVEGASLRYNLACDYSLAGAASKALDCLEQSVAIGYANAGHMSSDTDLDNLREEPRYKSLIDRISRNKTFWENPVFTTPFSPNLAEDEKIAGLSRLWMEAKYNFANFANVPDLNWDSLYVAYLPKVRSSESTREYYLLLQKFVGQLKDGHSNVSMPDELNEATSAYLGMATRLIEDRVIVVRVHDDSLRQLGIVPGVEITGVDGEPVKKFVERTILPYLGCSTEQDLMVKGYGYAFLSGYDGQKVRLDMLDNGGRKFTRTVTLGQSSFAPRPLVDYKVIEHNIAYVELTSFGQQEATAIFDSLYPQIAKADAIIFDVRRNGGGNSGIGWHMLGYLTDKPFQGTSWKTRKYLPSYRAWGYGTMWHDGSVWDISPREENPYYGPVVVLTSAQTYSAAEDFAAVFKQMERGKIIGEATGGSTGQPLSFALPGGGSARICTKHDSFADGREFVGVGILPDIEAHPTVKDIRSDRDAVLDAAIEYLKQAHKQP